MLLLAALRERVSEPFEPFVIHLANGSRLTVARKEFCLVDRETVTVVETGESVCEWTIDPMHIVAIEQEQPPLESRSPPTSAR